MICTAVYALQPHMRCYADATLTDLSGSLFGDLGTLSLHAISFKYTRAAVSLTLRPLLALLSPLAIRNAASMARIEDGAAP